MRRCPRPSEPGPRMYDIAVDIGGTFTDCVVHDVDGERIVAVPEIRQA